LEFGVADLGLRLNAATVLSPALFSIDNLDEKKAIPLRPSSPCFSFRRFDKNRLRRKEMIKIPQYYDWWFDNAIEFLGHLLERLNIKVDWNGGISSDSV